MESKSEVPEEENGEIHPSKGETLTEAGREEEREMKRTEKGMRQNAEKTGERRENREKEQKKATSATEPDSKKSPW